jgi:hypothetical protein
MSGISFQALQECWSYVYEETLAIMCGDEPPNEAQVAIARQDADSAMTRFKEYLERKK